MKVLTMTITKKRTSPGAGSVFDYKTASGIRYGWQATLAQADGTRKRVTRGGFTTRKGAQSSMGDAQADARKGAYVEPSKMKLGAYLDEWLDGLRLAPATVASYRKNMRTCAHSGRHSPVRENANELRRSGRAARDVRGAVREHGVRFRAGPKMAALTSRLDVPDGG
jgi:hypothetical protein